MLLLSGERDKATRTRGKKNVPIEERDALEEGTLTSRTLTSQSPDFCQTELIELLTLLKIFLLLKQEKVRE